MAFDPVPWFVGGGAQHSPEVARELAFAATSGNEGIMAIADLKVSQLATPGTSVQIAPGGFVIVNRATGQSSQTYVGRAPTATNLGVTATSSTGGRTDLVVVRIEDPFNAGEPWATPATPATGPYVFPRIISGVPAGTDASYDTAAAYLRGLGYSAIPLASITLPASTATVTNAHIKDLRQMANPRKQRVVTQQFPNPGTTMANKDDVWSWFPQVDVTIPTPSWAGSMVLIVTVANLLVTGTVFGEMRGEYGWFNNSVHVDTNYGGIHHTATSGDRQTVIAAAQFGIAQSWRGNPNRVRIGSRMHTTSTGTMSADGYTTCVIDVEFIETPI